MASYEFSFKIDNISCLSCKSKIIAHIQAANSYQSQGFELVAFNLDMETKALSININSEDSRQDAFQKTHHWLKHHVLKNSTFTINQAFLEANADLKPKWDTHRMGALIGLGFGLFWMLSSLGFWTLAPWIMPFLVFSNSVVLTFLAYPFLQNAWQQLKLAWNGAYQKPWFNMDSLFSLSGILVIAVSIASLYLPFFSSMLEAGFLVFGFRHLGIMFQAYLDKKMNFSKPMVQLFKGKSYQTLTEDGQLLTLVEAQALKSKDIIRCKSEQVIPVDGIIRHISSDLALVDNLKNGSYFPTTISVGEKVLAGTLVRSGEVELQVENPLDVSRLSVLDQSVTNIQSQLLPAPIQTKTQGWLQWFIPGLMVLALLTGGLVANWFSLALGIKSAVSLLVSACPCTLGLIVPMALRMGAYKASLEQAVFKSGEALQLAAQADILVLDYNGTLTLGKPQIKTFVGGDNNAHVQILYAIEQQLLQSRPGHLLGEAIFSYLKQLMQERGVGSLELSEAVFEDLKYGAKLELPTGTYYFGNNRLLTQLHMTVEAVEHRHYLLFQALGQSDVSVQAYLDIEDELRQDAKPFIESLKQRNKIVVVCTGADDITADKISRELSLERGLIKANSSFNDKPKEIAFLRQLYPNKTVAMLGDGINDKPALEASDLKILMKNSQLPNDFRIADSANLEIHSEYLASLIQAFDISEQTFELISQNLSLSIIYNFLVLGVTTAGAMLAGWSLHPAVGVLLMIVQSALLVLNTYRTLLSPVDNEASLERNMRKATC